MFFVTLEHSNSRSLERVNLWATPTGCLNKLITVESGNNFRVSCGDISFASKALRLTNEITPGSPDIIYLREYESNDTFSILFVLLQLVSVMALLYMTICKVSNVHVYIYCLLYTSPSPRDRQKSRMPSSA